MNNISYLNPRGGTDTYTDCQYLRAKSQLIDDIEAYLCVENPEVPKLYLFPTEAQDNDACRALYAKLQAVIQGTRCFIIRMQPQPLIEQVPLMLRQQAG